MLSESAILAAKNVDVLNEWIKFHDAWFQMIPKDLASILKISLFYIYDDNKDDNFPVEYFNTIDIPSMPSHYL